MVRVSQSLKGSDPLWRGMSETTALAPASTQLREATNVVISRDGTELRPAPGTRIAGKPFYGQPFLVTVKTVGASTTELTVDATADADGNAFLPGAFWVYVVADAAIYAGIRSGVASFTIPTIVSAVAVSGYVLIQRYALAHDMATVEGRAAIVTETSLWKGVTSSDLRNLATMVCSGPLSLTSPPGPGIPDDTDTGFVMWPSPTMAPMSTAEIGHDEAEIPILRNYDIQRRMQCDSLNGRLGIAVPGLGICFEANVRRAEQWMPRSATSITYQPNPRWTKMLGIPRGHMPNAGAADSGAGSLANGYYAVAVAYYDPYQDEIGLLSPIQVVEATGGSSALAVYATLPRGVAYEAVGLQVVLYLAGEFTTEAEAYAATVQPYYVSGPLRTSLDWGAQNTTPVPYCIKFTVSANFNLQNPIRPDRIGVLDLPPSGGSWIKGCRARFFVGDELPQYWDFEAWPYSFTVSGETFYCLILPHEWNENAPSVGPMAWGKLPPTVQGRIVSQINTASVANIGRIESLHNSVVGSISADLPNGQAGPHTMRVDFNPGTVGALTAVNLLDYRMFARPRAIRFTEEDRPGVSPGTFELPVDAISDKTTTGSARIGDQLMVFTLHQTHLFSWANLPSFASSMVLSNRFGCASPHSICEFSMGAAWLSDKGPCVSSGGPPLWIGEALVDTWEDVLKDSDGMVICAGAAVDEAESTIYWAVRRATSGAWASATTDTLKHKVACDTLLCWNWVTRGITVVERPTDIACLKAMLFDDGIWRPTIATAASELTSDVTYKPLYALTGNVERGTSASEFTATATRDPDTSLFACSGASEVAAAGDYAFVRSQNGDKLRWFGTVASVSPSGVTLNSTDGVGWLALDPPDVLVVCGPSHAEIRSHRAKLASPGQHTSVNEITIVARVDATYAYAQVTAVGNDAANTTVVWPAARLLNGVTVLRGDAFGDDVELTIKFIANGAYGIKDVIVGGEASNA